MMDWLHDVDFDLLALVFRFAVVGLIGFDIVLVNLDRSRGKPLRIWRSRIPHELLKNGMSLAMYSVIFVMITVLDVSYFPQPPLVIALDLAMLGGIVVLLLMPKKHALTDEGVLVNGIFSRWGTFSSFTVASTLKQIRFLCSSRLRRPVVMTVDDPERVAQTVEDYLEKD